VTARVCAREAEVLAALWSGEWPDGCNKELLMHAECCEICSEVMLIAPALRADYQAMRIDVQVPAAGQVWWRAAVRARMDAVHAASRPMTWAQGLAAAGAVGLLVALIGIAWPSLTGSLVWIVAEATRLEPARTEVAALLVDFLRRSLPLLTGVALCAVLAPVAVYLALSDE